MGRKLLSLRISTPDGWIKVPLDKVILFEAAPYPHVVERLGDGRLKHYFNFPMETTDEESAIVQPGHEGKPA